MPAFFGKTYTLYFITLKKILLIFALLAFGEPKINASHFLKAQGIF